MSGMTSERLDVLRRIAQMATPGPWERDGRIVYALTHYGYRKGIEQRANKVTISVQKGHDCSAEEADAVALHIATFDPTTVLALLDEIERLRREREEDDDKWTRYEELYVQARGQIVDLQLEIERLRREREVLAEALQHVYTCENCECALCPQGTGLSYRAYRALGEDGSDDQ